LYNLLTSASLSLPHFPAALLTLVDDPPKTILSSLSGVITNHLKPDNIQVLGSDYDHLAREAVQLLDVLAWVVPRTQDSQFAEVPRAPGTVLALLNPAHTTPFLAHATKALASLATRPSATKPLLALMEDGLEGKEEQDYAKLAQIKQLCALLLDGDRTGQEADAMRVSVLTLLTQLALSHPENCAALVAVRTTLPSLITFLTEVCALLWEEDEALMADAPRLSMTIRTIAHALLLIHHLVFAGDTPVRLRERLANVSSRSRRFPGVVHLFVVTFGRLSYADAPEAVSAQDKMRLEQLAGTLAFSPRVPFIC
jgi:hypothetical protein